MVMKRCEQCGLYDGPSVTVDAILTDEKKTKILLIERKNPPFGWALPGGFVDKGERLDTAVCREVSEETGVGIVKLQFFKSYTDPFRDPRHHIITFVFFGIMLGTPVANDDAKQAKMFPLDQLPELAFDHLDIINDWMKEK
jgi:ADP-ribose pyrophosphatase YjhB (NUDIX family)